MTVSAARPVYLLLGYAGLLPFVGAALAVAAGWRYAPAAHAFADAYAFGIIAFLCGSWWGLGLARDDRRPLLLSNLYFLVAVFVFAFAAAWWSLAAAILLPSLLFVEQNSSLFPAFDVAYRRMRMHLSLIAGASMLTLYLLSSAR